MSTTNSAKLTFRGDPSRFARRAVLLLLVIAPIPTLMIFGEKAPWAFALGCVPAGFSLAGLYFIQKYIDRAEIDDFSGLVAPSVGGPVAYTDITAVRFETDGHLTKVSFRSESRRPRPLLYAAGSDETARLRQALLDRCPSAEIEERKRSLWKTAGFTVVLLLALHAGFLYYVRQRWPASGVACTEFGWPAPSSQEQRNRYELAGMSYSVPSRFEFEENAGSAETHRYRELGTDRGIRVRAARLREWLSPPIESESGSIRAPVSFGPFYLSLLGINSTFDLMRWPYCDQIGAVPVVMKAALIAPGGHPGSVSIHEAQRDGWRALIEVDASREESTVSILAASAVEDSEILFTINGGEPDTELIAELLRGFGFPDWPATQIATIIFTTSR